MNILYCYIHLVSRFRQADDGGNVYEVQPELLASLSRALRTTSRILDHQTFDTSRPDIIQDLQLWQTAFLRSLAALHYYPSFKKRNSGPHSFNARPDQMTPEYYDTLVEIGDMSIDFKELVENGGMTGSFILHLYRLNDTPNGVSPTSVTQPDWLLVLMFELVKEKIISVTANLAAEITSMLQQADGELDEGQAIILGGRLAPDASARHHQAYDRLRVLGAIYMALFSSSRTELSTGRPIINPVTPTESDAGSVPTGIMLAELIPPYEPVDYDAATGTKLDVWPMTAGVLAAAASYINAISNTPDHLDVRAPQNSSPDVIRDMIGGPQVRMQIDHTTTLRFFEYHSQNYPDVVIASGLPAAVDTLLQKLRPLPKSELRIWAKKARHVLPGMNGDLAEVPVPRLDFTLEVSGAENVGSGVKEMTGPV